ncbi:unnamed protein product [Callosobruchus maculatus]|uniref:Dynein heavy chain linker domain-containing protein n=1 Tax=Callosobruchus maculatus TaxID=64391 RepID=A0A653CBY6_CALMS|nr:unnamed protein product [Callosobruchus maculatus]
MTHHLQMLCMNSLYDYVEYITDVKYSNKGFQIRLQQSANILAFEPTFKNFRDILIGLTDLIVEAVTDIPRLETKLYLDWGNEAVLKPLIPAELIDVCKNRIKDVLDEQRIGPELRVHDFDEFLPLINGQGDEFVNDFVSSDHNFDDYVEQILKYKALHERIPFATEHVVRMEMYDMNRLELIKALEHLAEYLKDALIHHCIKHYQQMCTTIGEDYQVLSERVLAVPQDTAGLMALKKFVNEVETKTLPSMEDRLRSVMTYILFLADHTIFTPVEMKVNNNAFQWYLHMPKVMEEHRQLVKIKTEEYQSLLTVKIKKFQDDLEMYAKMVEELQNNGNIKELAKYHRKATKLDERLLQAIETIARFNEEEASFGFNLSYYPLRQQVHDKLAPYKKLYDNATDFLNKCDLWMKSKVGTYDPKEVESDTGTFYKNISQLEKVFSEKPATQELVITIKERIEEFKEHMPIIQTLGNPGMKERHWEKVSEIVGFPIKLDAELTLEKIIDYSWMNMSKSSKLFRERRPKRTIWRRTSVR